MKVKEYNSVASLASSTAGIGKITSLQRHKKDKGGFQDPKKRKSRRNEDVFRDQIIEALFAETVKKKGGVWKLFDDDTGVELGSYRDRKAAWNAQRVKRQQSALRKAQARATKRNKKKSKVHHAKTKTESFENIVASALLESSPYVFEQSPTSQDSVGWENFIGRMSHEVMQSDPRLKSILIFLHKTRLKVLQQAYHTIENVLTKTREFDVGKPKMQQTESEDEPLLTFEVKMLDAKKSIALGIVIQHDKPVFSIPEESKALLNSLATHESKLLRAELMHVQETALDKMYDIEKATKKRNEYLKAMESKLDKMVSSMVPMQIALLRHLLKMKYRGMK